MGGCDDPESLRCGFGGVPEEAPHCKLKPENQYLLDDALCGRFNPTTAGQCQLS